MNPLSPVPFESLTVLSRAVDAQLAGCGSHTRSTVFNLCIEAVAFGREAEGPLVGIRARSAAHLLLELACPELDSAALHELAVACERAARGRTRDQA